MIPEGYCQCGCGEPTPLAPRTHKREGYVKGQPLRFAYRHYNKKIEIKENTTVRCACGCGEFTPIYLHTNRRKGATRGNPSRFISGHQQRKYRNALSQGHRVLYNAWYSMWKRCTDPNEPSFRWYGAKGISICDKWKSYDAFADDMGARPEGSSLDRIDSTKGYYPENCKWSTPLEQIRNRSNTILITHEEITLPLRVWAERLGIKYITLHHRLRFGWSVDNAFKLPVTHQNGQFQGKTSLRVGNSVYAK